MHVVTKKKNETVTKFGSNEVLQNSTDLWAEHRVSATWGGFPNLSEGRSIYKDYERMFVWTPKNDVLVTEKFGPNTTKKWVNFSSTLIPLT